MHCTARPSVCACVWETFTSVGASPRAAKFGEGQGCVVEGPIPASAQRPIQWYMLGTATVPRRALVRDAPPWSSTATGRAACAGDSTSGFCVCCSILSGVCRATTSHVTPLSWHFRCACGDVPKRAFAHPVGAQATTTAVGSCCIAAMCDRRAEIF